MNQQRLLILHCTTRTRLQKRNCSIACMMGAFDYASERSGVATNYPNCLEI